MMDWCGYVSRGVLLFSDILESDISHTAFIENVAYQFARMALHNLRRAYGDEGTVDQVVYHAAEGLLRGAAEGIALIDPNRLLIDSERKH